MAVLQAHNVRRGDVGVLVGLVRVVSSDAALGRERELGYDVADLVLRALLLLISCLRRLVGRGAAPIVISSCWRALVLLLFSLLLQTQLLRVGLHALIALGVTAQALAWEDALRA